LGFAHFYVKNGHVASIFGENQGYSGQRENVSKKGFYFKAQALLKDAI